VDSSTDRQAGDVIGLRAASFGFEDQMVCSILWERHSAAMVSFESIYQELIRSHEPIVGIT
jgi:hypothetical protein